MRASAATESSPTSTLSPPSATIRDERAKRRATFSSGRRCERGCEVQWRVLQGRAHGRRVARSHGRSAAPGRAAASRARG
eukprot:2348324-Alexandrium_andersonii.AAC.1